MENICSIDLTDRRTAEAKIKKGEGKRLAVILPGLNYGCDRPLLSGVSQLLSQRGDSVLELSFGYAKDEHFAALPESAQIEAIEQDGATILNWALEAFAPKKLTLAGKSLGTISMGGMAGRQMPAGTRALWLTPSLTGTSLLARMKTFGHDALSVIGSEDVSAEITRSEEYRQIAGLTNVEVPGMDHGWNHKDGDAATRKGLFTALAVVGNWLDSSVQLDKPGVM